MAKGRREQETVATEHGEVFGPNADRAAKIINEAVETSDDRSLPMETRDKITRALDSGKTVTVDPITGNVTISD